VLWEAVRSLGSQGRAVVLWLDVLGMEVPIWVAELGCRGRAVRGGSAQSTWQRRLSWVQ
jgi:hypothetical protein